MKPLISCLRAQATGPDTGLIETITSAQDLDRLKSVSQSWQLESLPPPPRSVSLGPSLSCLGFTSFSPRLTRAFSSISQVVAEHALTHISTHLPLSPFPPTNLLDFFTHPTLAQHTTSTHTSYTHFHSTSPPHAPPLLLSPFYTSAHPPIHHCIPFPSVSQFIPLPAFRPHVGCLSAGARIFQSAGAIHQAVWTARYARVQDSTGEFSRRPVSRAISRDLNI